MSLTKPEFNPSGKPEIDRIKAFAEDMAAVIENEVPDGRRKAIALTHLETAAMFAVKACFDDDSV